MEPVGPGAERSSGRGRAFIGGCRRRQGHARHRPGYAGRPSHGPDHGHPCAARALPRADLGLAGRIRPRERRNRPGRRRALGAGLRRQELDVLSAKGPAFPQRRPGHRQRREVQSRAGHVARVDLVGRRRAAAGGRSDRGRRRSDGPCLHERCHPAVRGQPLPGRLHGRLGHAQEVHRDRGRQGVSRQAGRQRPVEVRPERPGRSHRVRGRHLSALARHAAVQAPDASAGARAEHTAGDGAHRRSGHREHRARGGQGGTRRRDEDRQRAGHDAGRLSVLGALQA